MPLNASLIPTGPLRLQKTPDPPPTLRRVLLNNRSPGAVGPPINSTVMDQIIKTLSQSLGLPEPAVRAGVGIILNFVKQKSADSGNAQFTALLGLLPGASALMSSTPAGDAGGGALGGLLAKAGGLLGGNLGDAAAALGALQGAGIPMDKAGELASGFFTEAKGVAGDDAVNAVLKNLPAIASMLAGK